VFKFQSRRFATDNKGNVAIIFAAMLLPVLGIIGAAIDYKRTVDARTKMLTSLDGALLALGRAPEKSDAAAVQFLDDFIGAQLSGLGYNGNWSISDFQQSGARISADIAGSVPTTLMGLLGIEDVGFRTSSAVVREQKKVELALVLDNTGSMGSNGKIAALREAATSLINIMYDGDMAEERVKIALVPFVTGVNIKAPSTFSMDWMDTEGKSAFHGVNFDETITPDDGGGVGGGGGGVGWWGGGRWGGGGGGGGGGSGGGSGGGGSGGGGGSSGGGGGDDDEPIPANHFALFDAIPNAEWKGCVEARPEPYDTDDTAPASGSPDTLWVPWFWPDEPDNGYSYSNNYLDDRIDDEDEIIQAYTGKYDGHNASIDETPSNTSGPNKSCGQPIRPLTNVRATLLADVAQMTPWNGSGTDIAQGLVWGWRVLSPSVPFTEGVPYEDDETLKAIVLLSDGENVVVGQNNSLNYSDYNPYNYMSHRRLGTTNTGTAVQRVNDKVEVICDRVKEKNIRVYTILFDLNSSSLRTLFRDCATSENLYFDNPSPSQLEAVFQEIAYDLSNLRLDK
jgi:Flp pilus assembly protein TadG